MRDLTFWSLGSLGGASWTKLWAIAPLVLPVLVATPFLARGLNALALGEAEAFHLGVPVQRVKALAVVLMAVAVGASVAGAGMIAFVGIVVPHVLRLAFSPDHQFLLPASALLGASLLIRRHRRPHPRRPRRAADRHPDRGDRGAFLPLASPPRRPGQLPRMTVLLCARGVSFHAPAMAGSGRTPLVDDVDLDVQARELTVIVGPNGAGKSTLLRLLCGELTPSRGEILVDGRPIRSVPEWRLACRRAVLPQGSTVAFPFTARDVARLGVADTVAVLAGGRISDRSVPSRVMTRALLAEVFEVSIDGDEFPPTPWRAVERLGHGETGAPAIAVP